MINKNFFKAFASMFFLVGVVSQGNAASNEPFSSLALAQHVNVILNGVEHDLEVGSIVALADRIVGNSTPEKRNLRKETFMAIRDGLGHVRSAISGDKELDMAVMAPVLETLLKNCVKAHHKDVNAMLGKLGLNETQTTVLKTSLTNAATLLTSEDPVSVESVVVCCFKTAATVAEQLLAGK